MLYRTVVVAVTAVHVVQVSPDQVVHVVSVRHGLVAATGAVHVVPSMPVAGVIRRALLRVGGVDRQAVLVDVVGMGMVQMTIVEVVGMAVVSDGEMTTVVAMDVNVISMLLAGHGIPPRFERSTGRIADRSVGALESPK